MDLAVLDVLAPMLVTIIFIVTVGGVVLLRPLSRRLGDLLEVMARERQQPKVGPDLERIHDLLETMSGRLSLLEDRQDFTESLLDNPDRRSLRSTARAAGEEPGEAP